MEFDSIQQVAKTTLTGTTGADLLNAPGNVVSLVQGLAGNDSISLVYADDLAEGGKGNDSISLVRSGNVENTIAGGDGNDTIFLRSAGVFSGSIRGGGGNDSIALATANTTNIAIGNIYGDAGNDTISFGILTNSTIGGGEDADRIHATAANAITSSVVNGGMGADSIHLNGATTSFASIQAGRGNDTIAASAAGNVRNTLIGAGKGADSIYIEATVLDGTSTIAGGGLADTIRIDGAIAGGIIFGDANGTKTLGTGTGGAADGADLIAATGAAATAAVSIYGGGGADVIWVTQAYSGANLFNGGNGNDSISIKDGGASNYGLGSILGGAGDDTIRVSLSGNASGMLVSQVGTINGGDGADRIILGATNSSIVTDNATAFGGMTGSFNAILNYGAGDTIVVLTQIASNTFTAIANWSTGNPTLVSLTGAGAAAVSGDNAVTENAMSGQGNIGVFSNGTDTMLLVKTSAVGGDSMFQRILIKGADLQLTTVTGQAVSLAATSFGISIAAVTNGGMAITLT